MSAVYDMDRINRAYNLYAFNRDRIGNLTHAYPGQDLQAEGFLEYGAELRGIQADLRYEEGFFGVLEYAYVDADGLGELETWIEQAPDIWDAMQNYVDAAEILNAQAKADALAALYDFDSTTGNGGGGVQNPATVQVAAVPGIVVEQVKEKIVDPLVAVGEGAASGLRSLGDVFKYLPWIALALGVGFLYLNSKKRGLV